MNGKHSQRPMNKTMHGGIYKAGSQIENAARPEPVHAAIQFESDYAPIVPMSKYTCPCGAHLEFRQGCKAPRCPACRKVVLPCGICEDEKCEECMKNRKVEEAVQVERRGKW